MYKSGKIVLRNCVSIFLSEFLIIMKYDTIVIGAGAAGCSAAIYATRYNLKTLMLGGPMPGGLISEALDVENYPGYLSISGPKLAQNFVDQAVALGAEYKVEIADRITQRDDASTSKSEYVIHTTSGDYVTRSIILATGTHHRKLGIPGELEFAGRGVSYCSTCDAPFFKGKTVAVVGGGNSAVEGAQDIAAHADKVYIIYRSALKAAPVYVDRLRSNKKITEISNMVISRINGDKTVNSVTLDGLYRGSDTLATDGVFIQIGYAPQNDLAKNLGVEIDIFGYVKVDAGMGTSIPGIFCAGDLNNGSNQLHQQITSAAEGAIAGQSAYRHLNSMDYLII